jgi:hypothetical protein
MCHRSSVAAVSTVSASAENLFAVYALLFLTLLVPKTGCSLEVKIVVRVPGKL